MKKRTETASYARRLHARAIAEIGIQSSADRDRTLEMLGNVMNLSSPEREEAFVEMIMHEVREKAMRRKKILRAA